MLLLMAQAVKRVATVEVAVLAVLAVRPGAWILHPAWMVPVATVDLPVLAATAATAPMARPLPPMVATVVLAELAV